jgi:type IV secretory pathway TraG/TraD family ATPase VirD4
MMDTIFSPEILNLMREKSSVDFADLTAERSVLFVTTSAVNPSLNAFAGLFYSHAVKELFEYAESRSDGVLPIPIHLLCDDFAVGAQIPSFAEYISIFREKKISVSILLQSESQLRSMYGDADSTTTINNCDRYI